jgi:hypothetical protein
MALVPRAKAIADALEYYKGGILCSLQAIRYAVKHNDKQYLEQSRVRLADQRKYFRAITDMKNIGCSKEVAWKLNGITT